MSETFDVHLTLTVDDADSMNYLDTYEGLGDVWYRFESDAAGNITLLANEDGFEHLARFFLKLARTGKSNGYHSHHTLEFGVTGRGGPELTIGIIPAPWE